MGSEWTTKPLKEYIDGIVDNRGKTPQNAREITPFEMLEVNALKGSSCIPEYSLVRKYVSEDTFNNWFRAGHPRKNDVLISTVGSIGEVAISEGRGCIAQNIIALRPKPKELDGAYLYYFLSSRRVKAELLSMDISSVQPSIKVPHLMELSVKAPSIGDQHKISSVLSMLDKKIQLNNQTNETLEKMAQALFKSWFVDFDPVIDNALEAGNAIPDELKDRAARRQQQLAKPDHKPLPDDIRQLCPSEFELTEELGWVPVGWGQTMISDFCLKVQNGGTPRRSESKYWDDGDIPWLASGEVRQAIITKTKSFITKEGLNKSSAKLIPKGTTVIAMYGATAGQVAFSAIEMTTNQAVCSLIPKSGAKFFVYLFMERLVAVLENQARGSAQQNISKSIIEQTISIMPPSTLLKVFDEYLLPIFDRWERNLDANTNLAELRDTLLSKLISGELRLPSDVLLGAEQQIADVMS
jgi:type I restriction enzyme S subunit